MGINFWHYSCCSYRSALILRVHHPELPKDARTLLGTQKKIAVHAFVVVNITTLDWLRDFIQIEFDPFALLPSDNSIAIHIDGLPIFKSSKVQFGQFFQCLIVITQKPLLLLVCFVELENHLSMTT